MEKNLDDFLKKAKSSLIIPRSSSLTSEISTQIIQELQKAAELDSFEEAKTVAAVLFQQGGTARSCDGNMEVTVLTKKVKLATLRRVVKDSGNNRGERKLARSLATDIQYICQQLEVPGNLYKKIARLNPTRNFTLEEQTWLSDFQHLNPDTPENLRELISQSFDRGIISSPPVKFKKTGK